MLSNNIQQDYFSFGAHEFTTHIDQRDWSLILQYVSCIPTYAAAPLHTHSHAEIIMLESGTLDYYIEDTLYTLCADHFLAIPANAFHRVIPIGTGRLSSITLQLDHTFARPIIQSTISGTFSALIKELEQMYQTKNCGIVSAYLAQILSPMLSTGKQKISSLQNREYIIHEYIARHYTEDISLKDIAKEVNLSEKQASRLIQEYTGYTFRQLISRKRVEAALHLRSSGQLSLEEIAEQVGYHSYSSFWKAFQKYS